MTRLSFLFLLSILPGLLSAQQILIKDFIIKENLSQNGKLALIAVDSTEKTDDLVQGTFVFTVNGFQQTLRFHDGVAVLSDPIESSTFVWFKHQNQHKEVGKFYFIRKSDKGLSPIRINGMMFILIPALLLFIAYAFKRLLVVFIALAMAYAYLHFSKGLDLSQILDSFFLSIKNLI